MTHNDQLLLPAILSNAQRAHPFLLIQSDVTQPHTLLLRHLISSAVVKKHHVALVCFATPPAVLLSETDGITIEDFTGAVPGYQEDWVDPREAVLRSIEQGGFYSLPIVCGLI